MGILSLIISVRTFFPDVVLIVLARDYDNLFNSCSPIYSQNENSILRGVRSNTFGTSRGDFSWNIKRW